MDAAVSLAAGNGCHQLVRPGHRVGYAAQVNRKDTESHRKFRAALAWQLLHSNGTVAERAAAQGPAREAPKAGVPAQGRPRGSCARAPTAAPRVPIPAQYDAGDVSDASAQIITSGPEPVHAPNARGGPGRDDSRHPGVHTPAAPPRVPARDYYEDDSDTLTPIATPPGP